MSILLSLSARKLFWDQRIATAQHLAALAELFPSRLFVLCLGELRLNEITRGKERKAGKLCCKQSETISNMQRR